MNLADRSRTTAVAHSIHAARLIGVAETGTRRAVGGRRTPMSLRAATGIVTGLSGNTVKNRTLSLPRKVLNNNGLHILCDITHRLKKQPLQLLSSIRPTLADVRPSGLNFPLGPAQTAAPTDFLHVRFHRLMHPRHLPLKPLPTPDLRTGQTIFRKPPIS